MSEHGGATGRGDAIDLDLHAPEFLDDRFGRYAELRERCPVVFDTAYGGFWFVTDYENVLAVARDTDTFKHQYLPGAPDGVDYEGIVGYPRHPDIPAQGVSEIDGPDHHDLRRALNGEFSPAAVDALRPQMEAVATWFLDEIVERGHGDLVLDFTSPVPSVLTLQMMGLPVENWARYSEFFHTMSAQLPGTPEYDQAMSLAPGMMEELLGHAAYRREHLGADVTSLLLTMERASGPLTDEQVGNVMFNLVAGGVDTTTSLASQALHHLGTHPEARQRLIDEPELMPLAIEEYLRYFCPSESLTRTAARDVELDGQQIKKGDRLWVSWIGANRDPKAFDRADEVVIDRDPNHHLAFGLGGHRCIGMHLARTETEVMLREVLTRIPDYEIDPAGYVPYPTNMMMNGVTTMPASFTPGPRIGPSSPPFA